MSEKGDDHRGEYPGYCVVFLLKWNFFVEPHRDEKIRDTFFTELLSRIIFIAEAVYFHVPWGNSP